MKNIYLVVTDEVIESVRDLKKLEITDFATITHLNATDGWETFNATLCQAIEILRIVEACHESLVNKVPEVFI